MFKILIRSLLAGLCIAGVGESLRPDYAPVLTPVLLLLAVAATVCTLHQQLPLANVLQAAVLTGVIGAAACGFSSVSGIPFGLIVFRGTAGVGEWNAIPCLIPLFWVVAILNSRGAARLMLRPWRRSRNYGFWLIGLTIGLTLLFVAALEPFARARHLWLWLPTRVPAVWHGASPLVFLGWAFVTLLILAFITPMLIRKQPGQPPPTDTVPAVLWAGMVLWFAIGAGRAGLWSAVEVDALEILCVAFFCWCGARSQKSERRSLEAS